MKPLCKIKTNPEVMKAIMTRYCIDFDANTKLSFTVASFPPFEGLTYWKQHRCGRCVYFLGELEK